MIPPPDPEAIALADQYVPPSRVRPSRCPTAPALSFTSHRLHRQCCIPMSGNADWGSCPIHAAKLCLLKASGFLQEGFHPVCTQDGVGSVQSHPGPCFWRGGGHSSGGRHSSGAAAQPSLSRQVPTLAAAPALTPLVKTLLYPFVNMG